MATKKPSVRSNSKGVIEKNQKYILGNFHASDYDDCKTNKDAYVKELEHYMKDRESRPTNAYKGVLNMLDDVTLGTPYYYERVKYLNSVGLNKYSDPDNMTDKQFDEADKLYKHILARDGAKLYEEIKAEKTAKKPVKKSPAKKPSAKKVASKNSKRR